MANPNMIGGGRYTRAEQSGDRRGGLGTVKTSKKRLLLRLWKYLGHNRFLIVSALILSVCSNLLALWGPKLSGQAIDAIGTEAGKVDFASVFKYTQIMLVCYIVSAVISYVLSRVIIHLSRDVVYRMRRDVMNAMSKYPVSFFDKYQPGDIISIVTYDVDTVNQSLSSDLLQIVQSIITVTVSFVMMISIAPRLVIIFAFTVPLTFFFTKWLTGKVRPLFRRRSACLGEMNGYAEQMLSGQKTTKAYGCESEVNAGFEKKNEAAVDAYTKAEAYGTVTGPSVNFINNASLALVSVFGGLLFMNGSILLGDLSSFVQYSRKFSGPINEFANILGELQSSFAAAERVFMLIDAEPEAEDKADAAELTDVVGEVEFSDVTFGYVPERTIIKNFDMKAEAGSLVAIVGPTGAGKTTLINLLMRFYDIDSGKISVDGQDIYTLRRNSLRRAYAMVLQETWLFCGSIYDNIAYGNPSVSRERVIEAAKAAKIHNFIMSLPEGYDTVLSDNGTSISKGQKQLITIARAMLLDSPMLVLDEATSNVDTSTEMKIQEAMRTLMAGKTSFVIAHRLSTVRHADKIIVMRDGGVCECGTHDELMRSDGFYRKLYMSQFEAY